MNKLKEILDKRGIKPYEISRALGMHSNGTNIKRLYDDKGKAVDTTFYTLYMIAQYLRIPITDLLEDYEVDGTLWRARYLKRTIDKLNKKFTMEHGDRKLDVVKSGSASVLLWTDPIPDGYELNIAVFDYNCTILYRCEYTLGDIPTIKYLKHRISPVLLNGDETESIRERLDLDNFENLEGVEYVKKHAVELSKGLNVLISKDEMSDLDPNDFNYEINEYVKKYRL